MRRKNDVLIKYFQLANTMFLSHEELGVLLRRIVIEDDVDGLRYENLDEETANELRRMEQQWDEDYHTLRKKNFMVIAAKASLSIQVNKSTKAFEALRQRLNNKNLDDSVDDPEPTSPPAVENPVRSDGILSEFNVDIAGKVITFRPNGTSKPANFPKEQDIQDYLKSVECEDEYKAEALGYLSDFGRNEKWDRHWRKILSEAEESIY